MNAIPQLQLLADRISKTVALTPAAMGREIQAALQEATATSTWLPPERRRADHDRYARHLLHSDPAGRFSILAIVWDHGQMSPVHGHYCWCAVGIYQGELTETYYREDAMGGAPTLIGTTRRHAGTLSFDPAGSGIHRIANNSGNLAISLHVYGVPRDGISTGVNRIIT